jgi:hypothetical protein
MWDVDFMHPIDPGMAAIADMAVHLLQNTALGLLLHPLGRTDKELLQERLPPPMHAGKHPCSFFCAQTLCVHPAWGMPIGDGKRPTRDLQMHHNQHSKRLQ